MAHEEFTKVMDEATKIESCKTKTVYIHNIYIYRYELCVFHNISELYLHIIFIHEHN